MKRFGIFLTVLALLLALVSVPALAEDDPSIVKFNTLMASLKTKAEKADHVIGPEGVDTIRKYNMTIIQPGDTIAIVPDASYNPDAVQGGIGLFSFTIYQMNDPEVKTNYLKEGHKPEKTTLTEVEETTMDFPYGNYEIEGATSVTFVSLYKNDTGFPIVVRGFHAGSSRNTTTKTMAAKGGRSYEGYTTKRQAMGSICYAPLFFFVEPTYDLFLTDKTASGAAYEWNNNLPAASYKIYMDNEDHKYELPNPVVPGRSFTNWQRTTYTFVFDIHERGVVADGKTTFTFNMQAQMWKGSDMDPVSFAQDSTIQAYFFNDGNTVVYHAGEGTVEGIQTYYVDGGRDGSFNLNLDDYKAEREGYAFLGWGTDAEDPAGSLLKDATAENFDKWFKENDRTLDVYAAYGHTISFDAGEGTGTMEEILLAEGEKLTLPDCTLIPPKDYYFLKWDAGKPGDEIEITEDKVIKAIWVDHPVIPVGGTGWVKLPDGRWAYGDEDENAVLGMQTIGGTKYIFDEKGAMVTGWAEIDGKWYFAEDSGALTTGWKSAGGVWYFFRSSGEMATGWISDGGAWYYMKDSGAMATGWVEDGGDWYYFADSGVMATGWVKSGNDWYYMRPTGVMATGWVQDGAWYYFNGSGKMVTGWVQDGGTWYYFRSSGAMKTGWLELGNKWYWFDGSGAMATGWKEIDGQWEMFADSGEWLYTWDGNN